MNSKAGYRIWQFLQSLRRSPGENDWEMVKAILLPEELTLFQQLPVPDQNHSLRVLKAVQSQGESDHDYLKATLLHDIGKTRAQLRRWERILAVLVTALFPGRVKIWGEGNPTGLQRPLVVIQQHSQWGAELARMTGNSPRVVWFILNHELEDPEGSPSERDLSLLRKLQTADNNN